MKEQMEEEKAVIDRERAIAEGRDAEAKEEEVCSLMWPLMCFISLSMRATALPGTTIFIDLRK